MTVIRILSVLVLLAGLGACGLGSGEDQVDADDPSQALERQRTDVRAAAQTLLAGAEKELSGTTRTSAARPRFRGSGSRTTDRARG